MKMKLLILAATLSLTGCAVPRGDVVGTHTVGKIQAVGGNIAYSRTSPQFTQSSVSAGEAYLAEQRANDPISRDQKRVYANQAEFDKGQEKRDAARKCQMVVEIHYTALKENVYNNPTNGNLRALRNFEQRASQYFNTCMKKNYQEAK